MLLYYIQIGSEKLGTGIYRNMRKLSELTIYRTFQIFLRLKNGISHRNISLNNSISYIKLEYQCKKIHKSGIIMER